MANTALALLDTATEPAIAVEGRDRCEWLVSAVPTVRIVGDLLAVEIAEKPARSIKYQLTIAKLPSAKDIDDFDFTGTPVNEALIRDLASGAFSPSSATPCWSAVPAPAKATSP